MNGKDKVIATELAITWVKKLSEEYGELLFHQSGGCCDGSAPMCYLKNEFHLGYNDILLGYIHHTPFYISKSQYERWKHTQIIIDVVKGHGHGFSIEAPKGIRFISRAEVFKKGDDSS